MSGFGVSVSGGGAGVITGAGTINTVAKFTAPGVIGNSSITDDGTEAVVVSRLSAPGTGLNSERFGAGSVAIGDRSVVFGNGATADTFGTAIDSVAIGFAANVAASGVAIGSGANAGAAGIAIGQGANATASAIAIGGTASNNFSIAIGFGSNTSTAPDAIAIGKSAFTNLTATNSVVLGTSAGTDGGDSVIIGHTARGTGAINTVVIGSHSSVTGNNSIAIGYLAVAGTANTLVIGSTTAPITGVFIGSGQTSTAPSALAFNGQSASGVDVAGGAMRITGGRGTGAGLGGSFVVQTAQATGSSAVLNALATVFSIDQLGRIVSTLPANTNNLTLSTEFTDLDINMARTVTWATGAIVLQRFVRFRQPTMAFVAASVVTDAATCYIDGAPVAGANATLTNTWGLFVNGATKMTSILDLSAIAAGSPNIKITATSDVPVVTWGAGAETIKASTAPAGYLEITVGGVSRYVPFWI